MPTSSLPRAGAKRESSSSSLSKKLLGRWRLNDRDGKHALISAKAYLNSDLYHDHIQAFTLQANGQLTGGPLIIPALGSLRHDLDPALALSDFF